MPMIIVNKEGLYVGHGTLQRLEQKASAEKTTVSDLIANGIAEHMAANEEVGHMEAAQQFIKGIPA